MLFQSVGFLLIFFPISLIGLRLMPNGLPKTVFILLTSYLFYSATEPFFVLLLILTTVTSWWGGLYVARNQDPVKRKLACGAVVFLNFAILGVFKYGIFLLENLGVVLKPLGVPVPVPLWLKDILLPPGISFYTFQAMTYVIDSYRREIEPEPKLLPLATFVKFWPQLIAGPIERYQDLAPQVKKLTEGKLQGKWSAGLDRVAVGVIEKLLLADSCGFIVDQLLHAGGTVTLVKGWMIALAFGMQIYFDFAGYSHIAVGLALMLGVRLQENFLSPYKAMNIQEFWRRWHRTLSAWFRDYVYIPLGGNRHGLGRAALNVMVTFSLCGLWHGAGWNYVLWGTLHGLLLVGYRVVKFFRPGPGLPRPAAILITFVLVTFAWIPFRVGETRRVFDIWEGMVGLHGLGWGGVGPVDCLFVLAMVAFTMLAPNAQERWPGSSGWGESVLLWTVALVALVNTPQISSFIYFRF